MTTYRRTELLECGCTYFVTYGEDGEFLGRQQNRFCCSNHREREIAGMKPEREAGRNECILSRVQDEITTWSQKQFGDNPSFDPKFESVKLFEVPPFLGMVEELGEMSGAQCKRHQGRSGFNQDAKYDAHLRDAAADLLIFYLDWCRHMGIDAAQNLANVWDEKVSKRRRAHWLEDQAKEHDPHGTNRFQPEETNAMSMKTGQCRTCGRQNIAVFDLQSSEHDGQCLDCSGACSENVEQTGQGWAEPPELPAFLQEVRDNPPQPTEEFGAGIDVPETRVVPSRAGHYRSASYNRKCPQCHAPLHKNSTSPICTQCAQDNRNAEAARSRKNH